MRFFSKIMRFISNDLGSIDILAPVAGEIVELTKVPDVVFSDKIFGDGVAISPTGNKVVAPFSGKIAKIFEHNHCFAIESDSGIELFVHFGIDTVELKGKGFKRIAKEGQQVKTGDTILEVNLPFLKTRAKSLLTPVVLSNIDAISTVTKMSGSCEAGETVIMRAKR